MLVTILLVVVAIGEFTKKSLVINGFDVPASLEARGFTIGPWARNCWIKWNSKLYFDALMLK